MRQLTTTTTRAGNFPKNTTRYAAKLFSTFFSFFFFAVVRRKEKKKPVSIDLPACRTRPVADKCPRWTRDDAKTIVFCPTILASSWRRPRARVSADSPSSRAPRVLWRGRRASTFVRKLNRRRTRRVGYNRRRKREIKTDKTRVKRTHTHTRPSFNGDPFSSLPDECAKVNTARASTGDWAAADAVAHGPAARAYSQLFAAASSPGPTASLFNTPGNARTRATTAGHRFW